MTRLMSQPVRLPTQPRCWLDNAKERSPEDRMVGRRQDLAMNAGTLVKIKQSIKIYFARRGEDPDRALPSTRIAVRSHETRYIFRQRLSNCGSLYFFVSIQQIVTMHFHNDSCLPGQLDCDAPGSIVRGAVRPTCCTAHGRGKGKRHGPAAGCRGGPVPVSAGWR
jgi:hypothetical protein